MLYDIKLARK